MPYNGRFRMDESGALYWQVTLRRGNFTRVFLFECAPIWQRKSGRRLQMRTLRQLYWRLRLRWGKPWRRNVWWPLLGRNA